MLNFHNFFITKESKIFEWFIFEYFYAFASTSFIFWYLCNRIKLCNLILKMNWWVKKKKNFVMSTIRIKSDSLAAILTYDNDFIIKRTLMVQTYLCYGQGQCNSAIIYKKYNYNIVEVLIRHCIACQSGCCQSLSLWKLMNNLLFAEILKHMNFDVLQLLIMQVVMK